MRIILALLVLASFLTACVTHDVRRESVVRDTTPQTMVVPGPQGPPGPPGPQGATGPSGDTTVVVPPGGDTRVIVPSY